MLLDVSCLSLQSITCARLFAFRVPVRVYRLKQSSVHLFGTPDQTRRKDEASGAVNHGGRDRRKLRESIVTAPPWRTRRRKIARKHHDGRDRLCEYRRRARSSLHRLPSMRSLQCFSMSGCCIEEHRESIARAYFVSDNGSLR